MLIKIVSLLILLLGMPALAVAENNNAEQEILKLKIRELELKKQVLELEAQKPQQQAYQQPSQQEQKVAPSSSSTSKNSGYIRGPRGGCYTFSSSGRKRYVARSMCD